MIRGDIWRILGIERTDDTKSIRRAYADRLRAIDPDQNVDEFAALRSARDQALRLARAGTAPMQGKGETFFHPTDEGPAVPGQTFSPPTREVPALPDEPVPPPSNDMPAAADEAAHAGAGAEEAWHGEAGEVSPSAPEPFRPALRLDELLFPDGEQSEEGFTLEEYEEALQCIDAIIQDILGGDIERQQWGGDWLAERLAYAWPRSAQLLRGVPEALGWLEEKGQLSEHPAKAFLLDRLSGMYFQESVLEPGHAYNKAWLALSEPGAREFFDRFKVRKAQVTGLLQLIRERFPELESNLNEERVAAWEGNGTPSWSWPLTLCFIIGVQVLLRVIDSSPSQVDPPEYVFFNPDDEERQRSIAEQRKTLLPEIFGEPVEWWMVENQAPALARELNYTFEYGPVFGASDPSVDRGIIRARQWMIHAGADAGWDDLLETKQLKFEIASKIRDDRGASACVGFLRSLETPTDMTVSDEFRARERALAIRLLQDDDHDMRGFGSLSRTAMVPGQVIYAIMQDTGRSEEVVRQALGNEGDEEANCAVHLSLMGQVLRRPGDVSEELVRFI